MLSRVGSVNQMLTNQALSWDFAAFKTEVSHFQPTQDRKVVRNYRTPDILLKPNPSPPGAASQGEGAFEPRDVTLNARTEVAQLFVHLAQLRLSWEANPPSAATCRGTLL